MARIIAHSPAMRKGILDDDYTLYEDGRIVHEYDQSQFKFNLTRELSAAELKETVKDRLIAAASNEDKDLAKKLLGR